MMVIVRVNEKSGRHFARSLYHMARGMLSDGQEQGFSTIISDYINM